MLRIAATNQHSKPRIIGRADLFRIEGMAVFESVALSAFDSVASAGFRDPRSQTLGENYLLVSAVAAAQPAGSFPDLSCFANSR